MTRSRAQSGWVAKTGPVFRPVRPTLLLAEQRVPCGILGSHPTTLRWPGHMGVPEPELYGRAEMAELDPCVTKERVPRGGGPG